MYCTSNHSDITGHARNLFRERSLETQVAGLSLSFESSVA